MMTRTPGAHGRSTAGASQGTNDHTRSQMSQMDRCRSTQYGTLEGSRAAASVTESSCERADRPRALAGCSLREDR